ncbi:MAG: nucleotidyltransferase domain-containing protein [Eisenbergiella sp.]
MRECYFSIYGTNVVKIVLYGSYARGDFDEGSDIDIVAIVKGKREELQKKLRQIWDLSADLGLENDVVVSPMVIPYDEFMRYRESLPYYRNIEEEGRKIG